MKNYKDKTVLITGASSGIGESFAKQLDELGSKLILTARSEDKLNKLASQMNDAIVISGDLSDRKFPKKLYKEVKNKKLTVDIIINNAGFGYSGPFLDSEFSGYEEMLNLNIYSLMELTYLFMNDMLKRKSGGIINVSSLASYQPLPYFAVYAASKSFVTSFSLSLHEEYREKGINVLGVCPGYTKTNFNQRAHLTPTNVPGYIMSSDKVVKQSLKAFSKKKFVIINGKINLLARFFMAIIPTGLGMRVSKRIIKGGMDKKRW